MNDNVANDDVLREFSTVFTNEKAGMQNVDKDRVKRVVYGMSKDSAHHQNELRKQTKVTERISSMRAIQNGLSRAALLNRERELQPLLTQLEAQRDTSQVWLHVDMDAFYAACEERDNPELKMVPVAIGGMSMISTANYEARKYGVRAAMPGFIAMKLCPHLKFIKSNFQKYEEAAAQAREVFSQFDASFCSRGLDEASLCITEYCTQTGFSASQVAEQIRTQVHAKTGLTCSCGTAPNPMLAKICSDIRKPNGQFHVNGTREDVMAFIERLSVRKVPGIGRVSERLLAEFGVHSVSDLYQQRGLLSYLFSSSSMDFFMHVALGLVSTPHCDNNSCSLEGRKSVSHEQTFMALEREEDLQRKVAELAAKVSQDLQRTGFRGKCVTLKLKQTDFRVRQRSTTLPTYIDSEESIAVAAQKLLSVEVPIKVRLIGVKVSSLQAASSMTNLEAFLRKAHKCDKDQDEDHRTHPPADADQADDHNILQIANMVDMSIGSMGSVPVDAADCKIRHSATLQRNTVHGITSHHVCKECGSQVPTCDLQQHKDMHVAVALSQKMNGPSYLASRSADTCGTDGTMQKAAKKAGSPMSKQAVSSFKKQGKKGAVKGTVKMARIDLLLSSKSGKG